MSSAWPTGFVKLFATSALHFSLYGLLMALLPRAGDAPGGREYRRVVGLLRGAVPERFRRIVPGAR